jgi:hypothetical protein
MGFIEQAQRYFSDRGVHEETFKRHRIEIVPILPMSSLWDGSEKTAIVSRRRLCSRT